MTIRILMTVVLACVLSTPMTAQAEDAMSSQEISKLRAKVLELTDDYNRTLQDVQVKSNNTLARYQANLLIKVFSYEIYLNHKNLGVKRNLHDIEAVVQASYLCSWIFTDLGKDHIDRFIFLLQLAREESGYKKTLISSWKAGTYLPAIEKTVRRDSSDYGVWQINDQHEENIKIINHLYESGAINFKTAKIKRITDVMDIKTNCVARCIIETDRKSRGWALPKFRDQKHLKFLYSTMYKLEKQGLYSRDFAQKYYNIVPIKPYSEKLF